MAQTATTTAVPVAERVRVRVQEILLGAALAVGIAFLGWLALSVVQVREDIVQLRGEVALVHSEVKQHRAEVARNTESLQRIEALLLAERDGGENTPRQWPRGSSPATTAPAAPRIAISMRPPNG